MIKLIAVDMDGTFLDDEKKYNYNRFINQYRDMKSKGIKFVVASGNQYYQLKSFFKNIEDEIAYVAENGAYIVDGKQEIFTARMDKEEIIKTLDILNNYKSCETVLCGKNSAYIFKGESEEFFKYANKYYHKLKWIEDLEEIDDILFKFALTFPEEGVEDIYNSLKYQLGDNIVPVSSGHGDIDLIIKGIHKARGIKLLQETWGISDEQTAAFGDGGNDIEMLNHVNYSYVMKNANKEAKKVAKYEIGSNNEESVLNTIDSILSMSPVV